MTLSKLSIRNARRQARDYLVYFATIVMTAALIYAFNGLVFSGEIQYLSRMLAPLPMVIVLASIVVVCIIGWLVSYTTNFMLARRSRELGTYILIGLENRQVAGLFFRENLVVGGAALLLGLLFGNLIFQAIRAIILTLFGAVYHFAFSFSIRALGLTLFYFVLIYLSAQLKWRKRLRSMKIYDFIYYEKQNENGMIEKSGRRRKIFAISIVLGVAGTVLIMMGDLLPGILGAGCIIAFLYGFFASFSSGVPAWFERHAAGKYAGQNLLVFRTLTAKLATMGVLMATIALLFTATLISEGSGLVFHALVQSRALQNSCFDLLISSEEPDAFPDCLDYIGENIPVRASMQYCVYLAEGSGITDYLEEHIEYYRYYEADTLMRASDYMALREMLDYPEVTLEPGQYLIHCQPYVAEAMKGWTEACTVGGRTLMPGGIRTEILAQYLYTVNGNGFILIVPDEVAEACAVSHRMYAALTEAPVSEAQNEDLSDILYNVRTGSGAYFESRLIAKSVVMADAASTTAVIVLPLYYLALVCMMTAAAILTIQQLSETERYRRQFALLGKLGMDRREMVKALRTQLAVYYALPALPAILIGVPFVVNLGGMVEAGIMTGPIHPAVIAVVTLGLFLLIYAVYILLAYTSLKRNVLPYHP